MDKEVRKKYTIKNRSQKEKMIVENSKMKKIADPEKKETLFQSKGKFKGLKVDQLEQKFETKVQSLFSMEMLPDNEEERKEFIEILKRDVEIEIDVRRLNTTRLMSQKIEEVLEEITSEKAKADANVWIANTVASLIKSIAQLRGEPTEHTKKSISITDMTEEQLNKREAELNKIIDQIEDNTIDIEAEPNALSEAVPTVDLNEIFGKKEDVLIKKEGKE